MRGLSKRRLAVLTAAVVPVLTFGASGAIAPATGTGYAGGADPVAKTQSGVVRGVAKPTFDEFLGLPYAAPPVRELRFAPPAASQSWQGIRAADRQAPACLQFEPTGVREEQAASEDCLYLDLYRPANVAKNAKLPVMVWFHGGGHTQGTGVIYGGGTMAAKTDTIIISINYRLGGSGSSLIRASARSRLVGPGTTGAWTSSRPSSGYATTSRTSAATPGT